MDVIAFGSTFLELVFGHIDRLPEPGEEIFTSEFAISCGGGAVTVASAARRAGVRAGIATVLGTDLGSRVVWEYCRRHGIDMSPSIRVAGPAAGVTVVLNFKGERSFISHLPDRAKAQETQVGRWLSVLQRERPAWIYLHPGPGVAPLLREARALGVSVALDVAFGVIDEAREDVIECVRLADVCLPNEQELCRLTGATSLSGAFGIASGWGTPVIAKCGPRGAVVLDAGQATPVTAGLSDVVVRDRTGAGDAFAGALIAALVQGSTLVEAAAAGNAAGSRAVALLGAVGQVDIEGLGIPLHGLGALAHCEGPGTGGPVPPDAPDTAREERPPT